MAGAGRQWSGLPPGEAPYRALVESVTDYAILLLDLQGVIRSWNAGAELIEGYRADEAIGRHFSIFYTPADIARGHPGRILETAGQLGRAEEQGWRLRKDGQRFWARVVVNALRDEDGAVYGYGKIASDLTQEKSRDQALRRSQERTQALREQALRDPLTGAYNRRHLLDFLRRLVDRSEPVTASLLAVDIDHFKAINDRRGHDVGDQVLLSVANLAGALSRASDRLFRIGGDEFLVYLPGVAVVEARAIAERLREAVEQARLAAEVPVTVSIGVAQLAPADSLESWIQNADQALYEAKRTGRNRVA